VLLAEEFSESNKSRQRRNRLNNIGTTVDEKVRRQCQRFGEDEDQVIEQLHE
jgi:hypothetical protein